MPLCNCLNKAAETAAYGQVTLSNNICTYIYIYLFEG